MAHFNEKTLRAALECLGRELGPGEELEISVIGGAAAQLIGALPPSILTDDVDAVNFRPAGSVDEILSAAARVARILSLPGAWLSHDDPSLFSQVMPKGWELRRIRVGSFGRLKAFAISRQDLIATKFYAHRQKDLFHLAEMAPTSEELNFAKRHLSHLRRKTPGEVGAIERALYLLAHWGNDE